MIELEDIIRLYCPKTSSETDLRELGYTPTPEGHFTLQKQGFTSIYALDKKTLMYKLISVGTQNNEEY